MPGEQQKQTYRVIGVRPDGGKVTLVRAAEKEIAEKIVTLLMAEKAYERMEIEPEPLDGVSIARRQVPIDLTQL